PGARPKPDNRVFNSEIRVIESLSGGLTQISSCEALVLARRRASCGRRGALNCEIQTIPLFCGGAARSGQETPRPERRKQCEPMMDPFAISFYLAFSDQLSAVRKPDR